MKTLLVLMSAILVSILFCIVAIAAPPFPSDIQIVQPDPSLPKDLAAFFGKWEGSTQGAEFFLIVEGIDEEKGSLYTWSNRLGWYRYEAKVDKEFGNYVLWFRGRTGINRLMLNGKYLDLVLPPNNTVRLIRVP